MIPYQDFRRLLVDSSERKDLDSYIAEVGDSVPMDDVTEVIRCFTAIWEMGHEVL